MPPRSPRAKRKTWRLIFWALLESREGGGLLGEFSQAPDKKDDGEADASKAAQNF
jgi:hypothetical protein